MLRAFTVGSVAGLATVALMYLAASVLGFQPLPELLQQPLLNVLPGPVFGFLIDTLQHAGKVLEELGLIVALVAAFGLLGMLYRRGRSPLVITAIGWIVIAVILLPLSGQGLLGLGSGFTQAAVWAVLMLIYAWLLYWLLNREQPAVDQGRRRLLTAAPVAVAGASVAALGLRLVPGWAQSVLHPAESGLSGLSPEITPVGHFYLVSKNFQDPVVAAAGWRLRVDGLASSPLSLDYAALQKLPVTSEYVTLECISNDVGGNLISTGQFTGVSLRDLLQMAGPHAGASAVNFSATDGYTESLPLAVVNASPEILVAYQLDGNPLPTQHGFPARILIPGRYGMKGPKWLQHIALAAQQQNGYWEEEGWDHDAVVKTTSRIDTPQSGALVGMKAVEVGGVAFAGKRGISAVEVSFDGGRSWGPADVQPPLSAFTWVIWRTLWTPAAEGGATLVVRARDGGGALQAASGAASFPSGSSGYHSVQVTVTR